MNPNVLVAAITTAGSAAVAITALILGYRGFASIDARFASIDARFASIERRLDAMQADLKEFYKILAEHDKRIQRLEDKT